MNLVHKILSRKLIEGELKSGSEILIKIDQTLTQDTTGTMVYLQLEALACEDLKTDCSVAYIDHNTLQLGFENADDHEFIRSAAERYGITYSKAGNGICHQLHFEQFAKPGITLLGSDSHTPTAGGMGAIAIGSGGLDVAVAMAKGYYFMKVPKVYNIHLTGQLKNGVSAKDIILTVLQKLSVSGGVGAILEYSGDGVQTLSATERATICNMGAELGATTSIFPSDEETKRYLIQQNRREDYQPLAADADATYDQTHTFNLDEIVPMVACPHSPDNVVTVESIAGMKVNQVAIGSCTNSSFQDLMKAVKIIDQKISAGVSLIISPGSSSIVSLLQDNGALAHLNKIGARILEPACGPCIGMGQAPISNGISLRTFNRNFKGRCGTQSANVYLVSPETAAASALTGVLTDPRCFNVGLIREPDVFPKISANLIGYKGFKDEPLIKGPNIKDFPLNTALENQYKLQVTLKTADNVSTDDIVPSTAQLLPLRSNIPELAKHCFRSIDGDFYQRAMDTTNGMIIGGENYGQGSSREHAALVPLYLGIKVVLAKSFARIHKRNLINSGIIPFTFNTPEDYELFNLNEQWTIENMNLESCQLVNGNNMVTVTFDGSKRDQDILKAGGYINYEK